jgi:hypothetical protein
MRVRCVLCEQWADDEQVEVSKWRELQWVQSSSSLFLFPFVSFATLFFFYFLKLISSLMKRI